MNGRVISSAPVAHLSELSYRVEIYQGEPGSELMGEANVIGSASFSRDKQTLNRSMIKRYLRCVASRRGVNYPWFIPDELANEYGINTALPPGVTADQRPSAPTSATHKKPSSQLAIDDFFMTAETDSGSFEEHQPSSQPLLQFQFPCDDAMVPTEFVDPELTRPECGVIDQFISSSPVITRSLAVWTFCQSFSTLLRLSPFSYDDWEEAFACVDPTVEDNPIIKETFLALLSGPMKDRRSLSKAIFADKLKACIVTFNVETLRVGNAADAQAGLAGQDVPVVDRILISDGDDREHSILLSDNDEEDENTFVKRSRRQPVAPKINQLPTMDLRRLRWYENKAAEHWQCVLASFYLEALDLMGQFIETELATYASEAESDSHETESNVKEMQVDTAPVDIGQSASSETADDAAMMDVSQTLTREQRIAQNHPLQAMQAFCAFYTPIVDRLTAKGSKELTRTFLGLEAAERLALFEFLVHFHFDRDTFRSFVEECLESQGELRRERRELETELADVNEQVSDIERQIEALKETNTDIGARLDASEDPESDIALSTGEEDEDDAVSSIPAAKQVEHIPLTDEERQELLTIRTANRKEIASLNAVLRRLRPDATALQRRTDQVFRELRRVSSYRTVPLGSDRGRICYWWLGDFVHPMGRILMANEADGTWLGCYDTTEQLDQLMAWLNPLGIREAKLKAALMEVEADLRVALKPRDLPEHLRPPELASVNDALDDIFDDETDVAPVKRGRGRPRIVNKSASEQRPFQRYKNTL